MLCLLRRWHGVQFISPSVTPYTSVFSLSTLVFFTAFACLITVLFNTFHINDYVFTSPQLVHIVLSISNHNLLCHNLIIYPATLCALSLYIWLFPTSFFTLSLLLIDRSRRKTLHTLHCQYHLSTLNAVSQNMDRS